MRSCIKKETREEIGQRLKDSPNREEILNTLDIKEKVALLLYFGINIYPKPTIDQICEIMNKSRPMIYNYINRACRKLQHSTRRDKW